MLHRRVRQLSVSPRALKSVRARESLEISESWLLMNIRHIISHGEVVVSTQKD